VPPRVAQIFRALARKRGGLSVLKEDEIWLAEQEVWAENAGRGVAGRGDTGRGVAGRGDTGRGVAGRGNTGRGQGRGRGRGRRGEENSMVALGIDRVAGDGQVDDDNGGRGGNAAAGRHSGRGRGRGSGRGGRERGGSNVPRGMIGRGREGIDSSDGMLVGDGRTGDDNGGRGGNAAAGRHSGRGRGRSIRMGGRGRGDSIAPRGMIGRGREGVRSTDNMVVGDGRTGDDNGGRGGGAAAGRHSGRGRGRGSGRGVQGRVDSIAPRGMVGRGREGVRSLDGMVVGDGVDASLSNLDPPELVEEISDEMRKRHARARAFALGLPFSE